MKIPSRTRHRLLLGLALSLATWCQAQQTLYVSSTGNDANDGSVAHPLATIEAATRKTAWNQSTTDTLVVKVLPGDYYLNRTWTISKAPGRPVAIRGERDAKPRIIGGMRIDGWQRYNKGIYRTPWPQRGGKYVNFEQLYVNGRRATLARTPNEGWAHVQRLTEEQRAGNPLRTLYLEKEHQKALRQLSEEARKKVRVHMLQKWDVFVWDLSQATLSKDAITFTKSRMNSWNPVIANTRYALENYRGALDAPGEWFADETDRFIYYIPRQGEDMASAETIVPTLEKLLVIQGRENTPIRNITIENLTFCCSSHLMPAGGEGTIQSAAEMTAAVELNFAEQVTLRNCDITHTGAYGLWYNNRCSQCLVTQCRLTDLGAGGIKLGNYQTYRKGQTVSNHLTVDNNIIADGGKVMECGAGILNLHSSDNTITHNDIHHFFYTGVSVGWVWGYNEGDRYNPTHHVTVAYNHIHDIGQHVLSDLGGIYTLGEQPGTLISNNVVHDIQAYDYGGMGIYTDEGSSHITIRNNLVYRCSEGCYQHHYGRDNVVENNIFAFSQKSQVLWIKQEGHRPFTFRHNIVLHDAGTTLNDNQAWRNGKASMESNLYWASGKGTRFGSFTFSQWRSQREAKAVEADPMFVDPTHGNFHFRALTNASRIGFTPFNYDEAGVYGPMKGVSTSTGNGPTVTDGTIHFPF